MDADAELLALYRAAPNDCKATILLALAALDESSVNALLEKAPDERKQIVLAIARNLIGCSPRSPESPQPSRARSVG
jgi:hypothetical protein